MRTNLYFLTDESYTLLVDENGNYLAAQIEVTDYETSAYASALLLHGPKMIGAQNDVRKVFFLVDENADFLVDENGDYLVARILIATHLLHADSTRTVLHGG